MCVCACVRLCASQRRCPECDVYRTLAKFSRHRTCRVCRKTTAPHTSARTTEQQVTRNATSLLLSLPPHSHHRAALLHQLSQGLTSHVAAAVFGASASYIRACKRKTYDDADLVKEKYAHGVKRQKLEDGTVNQLFHCLTDNCPTRSGSKQPTLYQYVTDGVLFQTYLQATISKDDHPPVSFSTFLKLKHWMRVRKVHQYFGHFDCRKCVRSKQLLPQIKVILAERNPIKMAALEKELTTLIHHRECFSSTP
jgi:hypothetical protein